MTGDGVACPLCAAPTDRADRFCESCGGPLFEVPKPEFARVEIPRAGLVEGPCADCGLEDFSDGYCSGCGRLRAEPDRDEARIGGAALVTDRGLHHPRNEDAAAAGTVTGGALGSRTGIAVAVCDGVSTSGHAEMAATAASKAGRDGMLAALATSTGTRAAVLAGLADATTAAVQAGVGLDKDDAPSCTYTAAAMVPNAEGRVEITVGSVGDSRAYWLPDPPALPRQLTVDDSVAQELLTAGAAAGSEFVLRGAHTITRWLGADSEPKPWSDANVQTITVAGPGALLLCSDGLWNYLPDAAAVARFCGGIDPASAARALTEHALAAGGHDNVTVAVIPIGAAS